MIRMLQHSLQIHANNAERHRRYRRERAKPTGAEGEAPRESKRELSLERQERFWDRLPLCALECPVVENCPTDDVYERHDGELSLQIGERRRQGVAFLMRAWSGEWPRMGHTARTKPKC
jgi:hypothetical protein